MHENCIKPKKLIKGPPAKQDRDLQHSNNEDQKTSYNMIHIKGTGERNNFVGCIFASTLSWSKCLQKFHNFLKNRYRFFQNVISFLKTPRS